MNSGELQLFLIALTIILLIAVPTMLVVDALVQAKSMWEVGIVLVIAGVLFCWPLVAVGAILIMANSWKEND